VGAREGKCGSVGLGGRIWGGGRIFSFLGTGANATRRESKAFVSPFNAFSIAAWAYMSSNLKRCTSYAAMRYFLTCLGDSLNLFSRNCLRISLTT
jgi:hypothetical protein